MARPGSAGWKLALQCLMLMFAGFQGLWDQTDQTLSIKASCMRGMRGCTIHVDESKVATGLGDFPRR